jgi:UPF0716 protein FxsA
MLYGQASQQGLIRAEFAPGRPLPSSNTDSVALKFLLPLVFIGLPIAEIALFIEVGGLIGLWPTLVAIVGTAVVGTAILRHQGIAVLGEAQLAMDGGRLPIDSVIHGLFLLIAGILLLTPGFLTDAVGFALLVPPVRLAIARWLLERLRGSDRVHIHTVHMGGFDAKTTEGRAEGQRGAGPVIEGEAVRVEDDDRTAGPESPSPWRP